MLTFCSNTEQGRHALIAHRGPWAFINVHAESGPSQRNRDCRNWQLDFLSTRHDCDELHIQVLAGDLNMREGEEQCLLQQGWKDAWTSRTRRNAAEDWTWKKGESSMRFDRCYVHSRRHNHHVFPLTLSLLSRPNFLKIPEILKIFKILNIFKIFVTGLRIILRPVIS